MRGVNDTPLENIERVLMSSDFDLHIETTVTLEKRFDIQIEHRPSGLLLYMNMAWGEKWLGDDKRFWASLVTYSSTYFTRDIQQSRYYSGLLTRLGTLIYIAIRPDFGYVSITSASGDIWFDDLEQCETLPVFWATYFGSAYTARMRHTREDLLLLSNSYKTIQLDDGGLLSLTSPSLMENSPSASF